MADKKLFFCEDCGQTMFTVRKPLKCKYCEGVFSDTGRGKNIGRILTEKDLPKLKK